MAMQSRAKLEENSEGADSAAGEQAALKAQNLILPDEEADRAPRGDRYRLKALVFSGKEDVEQFIMKFGDVAAIIQ